MDVRAVLRERALPARPRPEAEAGRRLAEVASNTVDGVLFFGSQRTKAEPDAFSAYDFFVVVAAYGPFYGALAQAGRIRRRPWLHAALNRVLPPSQISLRLPDGRGGELHAKCSVISAAHFARETSPRRRDHFTIGRLFQPAEVLYARDAAAAETLVDALVRAAGATFGWGRPWLPERFDPETYLRTLLRVSFGREVRPEPTERRTETLHEAQREEQVPVYARLLAHLARTGELRPEGGAEGAAPGAVYALARPVRRWERVRQTLFFWVSTVRATARWFKYLVTFEGWLDYIRHKAERHTGRKIELTPQERAFPLLFLWPRVFRYLRHKNDPRGRPPADPGGR